GKDGGPLCTRRGVDADGEVGRDCGRLLRLPRLDVGRQRKQLGVLERRRLRCGRLRDAQHSRDFPHLRDSRGRRHLEAIETIRNLWNLWNPSSRLDLWNLRNPERLEDLADFLNLANSPNLRCWKRFVRPAPPACVRPFGERRSGGHDGRVRRHDGAEAGKCKSGAYDMSARTARRRSGWMTHLQARLQKPSAQSRDRTTKSA